MFKIDSSFIKKNFKYYIIPIFFGLIFLGVGIFIVFQSNKKQKEFDSTIEATNIDKNCENKTEINVSESGTSVNSSNLCYPIYYYKVEGREYVCKSSTGVNKSLLGKNKNKVFYDSKNPENCMTEFDASSKPFIYIMVFGLGSITLLFGIISLIKGVNRLSSIEKLKQTGTLFKNLTYGLKRGNFQAGNKIAMCAVVNVPLPNNTTIKLTGDSRYDLNSNNKYIDVLVDLNNPKNYYFIDYDIEYTGDDPNRVIDLKQDSEEIPLDAIDSSKPKLPVDPILEEKTIAIPTIAAGAVPIIPKTRPEPPSNPDGIPNIVNEFAAKKEEVVVTNEPISKEALEPAVLIPGVNSPIENTPVETNPEPTTIAIGDEPAVVIPGINDGSAPAQVEAPAPPVQTVTPAPTQEVGQTVAQPAAPVAEPASVNLKPTPEPVATQQPQRPILGPVTTSEPAKPEVIPIEPVLGPDEPMPKDDLPSWAQKGE